jgi:hypothetical protein
LFGMQTWQLAVGAIATIVSLGWTSAAIVRLFSRRAQDIAVVRDATDAESALVGATVPAGVRIFDGWSYRMGARFAGRVRVAVYEDRVAVAGPRVPRRLYQLWVWVQGLLLALVLPFALTAVLTLTWTWLAVSVLVFVVSFAISMGGAGVWPGLGELYVDESGHFKALEFPRASVREVDIGKGWSKGGFEVVLFPYKAGIDAMSEGKAVSFFAPDESGHEVRFALQVYSGDGARELADVLDGGPT